MKQRLKIKTEKPQLLLKIKKPLRGRKSQLKASKYPSRLSQLPKSNLQLLKGSSQLLKQKLQLKDNKLLLRENKLQLLREIKLPSKTSHNLKLRFKSAIISSLTK
jgi:hypothetical protein